MIFGSSCWPFELDCRESGSSSSMEARRSKLLVEHCICFAMLVIEVIPAFDPISRLIHGRVLQNGLGSAGDADMPGSSKQHCLGARSRRGSGTFVRFDFCFMCKHEAQSRCGYSKLLRFVGRILHVGSGLAIGEFVQRVWRRELSSGDR